MTADNMPTTVFKEDTIDNMLELIKSQLNINIFTHYDAAAIDDANTMEGMPRCLL